MAQLNDTTVNGTLSATAIEEGGTALDEKYNPYITWVSVSPSSAISFTSGTWKEIARVTCAPGTWLFVGYMSWPANSTGHRVIGFNSVSIGDMGRWRTALPAVSSGAMTTLQNIRIMSFESTTTVYFCGCQTSGTTISTDTATMHAMKIK